MKPTSRRPEGPKRLKAFTNRRGIARNCGACTVRRRGQGMAWRPWPDLGSQRQCVL